MKIFILFAILGMMLFSACTEQDIEPFGERHEVYFYKYFMDEEAPGTAKADSTDVTFFFAKPTDDHVMAEIVVALAGRPLTKDLHFGLKVVKDMTTATPDEYVLENSYTFRARPIPAGASLILDTIQIRMNRSARLNDLEEGIRLVVEIVPSDELQVGQFERRYPFDERCCETGMVDPGSFCRVAGELFILEIQDIPGEYTGSIQFGWKYDKECS